MTASGAIASEASWSQPVNAGALVPLPGNSRRQHGQTYGQTRGMDRNDPRGAQASPTRQVTHSSRGLHGVRRHSAGEAALWYNADLAGAGNGHDNHPPPKAADAPGRHVPSDIGWQAACYSAAS